VSFVRVESGVDPVAHRDARFRMGLTQHQLARLINAAGGERISRWDRGEEALNDGGSLRGGVDSSSLTLAEG